MGWGRKRRQEPALRLHRGRIYWSADGWWRYRCTECGYGAGASIGYASKVTVPWLIRVATRHARNMVER